MDSKNAKLQRYLYRASVLVLLIGLLSAGLVYYHAADGGNHGLGYQVVDGVAYAAGESKAYVRDMEMYGGTSGRLIAGFNQWLMSLWHGKRLAYVIAIGVALISYACFWFARELELFATDEPEV
ncbi:hypothetical protein BCF11_2361 [Collimonas sp. PA-H2]|uniref:hypothetical protein n=1 Tax=Collimonas sp. PA-H2 TaxID=1881062 RepID=UPI000BF33E9E|nr:hypothetical protein [Collimonas sp. PA-H2]PFH09956.1 hypothetical protein BCF11_2361 [Collimonas sp. PA-H2]